MKLKTALLIILILSGCCLFGLIVSVMGEGDDAGGGVSLSPPYMDLGTLDSENYTFNVIVYNKGDKADLNAVVDSAQNTAVKVEPSSFPLDRGERKTVKVTVSGSQLEIGYYDLSVYFTISSSDNEFVRAYGTNSMRLIFRKEGLAMASCNVRDMAPEQKIPFYSILCSFLNRARSLDVSVEITDTETGRIVQTQQEEMVLQPYPEDGYYGRIETPPLQEPWEYGSYEYRLTARDDTGILLEYTKTFAVGEMRGELTGVYTKDVTQGESAVFNATIKNVGTIDLPVKIHIDVKNSQGDITYYDVQAKNIAVNSCETFHFIWSTEKTKPDIYTIYYTINMGTQILEGSACFRVMYNIIPIIIISCIIIICIIIILCIKLHHYRITKKIIQKTS